MKTSLLLVLGSCLANAYVFPDIAYDQTKVTCDNAATLLALTSSDLSRLKYASDVLIPSRLGRLNVVKRAVGKICESETGASFVQKSNSRSSAKEDGDLDDVCSGAKDAITTLSDQLESQQLSGSSSSRLLSFKIDRLDDMLWSVTETCNLISERLFDTSSALIQLKKKNSHLKGANQATLFADDGEDIDEACQGVSDAVDNLSDYLEALVSEVQSTYVEEVLPSRLKTLTQSGTTCIQTSIESMKSSMQSDLQTSIQTMKTSMQSDLQSSLKSSVNSTIQAAIPSIKSSMQSDIQTSILSSVSSTIQTSIQSSVDASVKAAIPSIQSTIQSSITVPTPKIVRLQGPSWQFYPSTTEAPISAMTYKVSLAKDTLIECTANGFYWANSRALLLKFMVDGVPMPLSSSSRNSPGVSEWGSFLGYDATQYAPLTYTMMMVVPKGDHTLTLNAFTADSTGRANIVALDVVYKINP